MTVRKTLDRLYDASLVLAGAFLVGIFLLMIGESAFRAMGSYITGANELVGWFCAASGFMALPATFKRGDMVRVGFLVDRLPDATRKTALSICLLIAFVFVSYMTYAVAAYLYEGWRTDELTQGMILIAVWIPQASFLVGAVLLWVAIVDELVVTISSPAASLKAERDGAAAH